MNARPSSDGLASFSGKAKSELAHDEHNLKKKSPAFAGHSYPEQAPPRDHEVIPLIMTACSMEIVVPVQRPGRRRILSPGVCWAAWSRRMAVPAMTGGCHPRLLSFDAFGIGPSDTVLIKINWSLSL
ncbi:MAG: hypothetical protein L0Y37_00870 [Bacteroidales bacterium]|nr:hypothetical protein [Bacteroidales bacterium]